MAKKDKKQSMHGKSNNELKAMLDDARKEIFTLRLDNSQRKLKNTSSITTKRKEIARILTAVRAGQLQ